MTVHPMAGGGGCLLLEREECPAQENFTSIQAKALAQQAFPELQSPVELEGFWGNDSLLIFARQGETAHDFATLFRREILTGCGILFIDAD